MTPIQLWGSQEFSRGGRPRGGEPAALEDGLRHGEADPLVLVIDDDRASLDLMSYLLGSAGYRVHCATEGVAGVEEAIRLRPELILCDIGLPDIDGFAVLAALMQQPRVAAVPVVAVTAAALLGDRQAFLRAGFAGYLAKPLEPAAFIDAVNGLIDASSNTEN